MGNADEDGKGGGNGKVTYMGKEYDYVFKIDIDEGRMLKLPYNVDQDPWMVAQNFLHEHDLPQGYLDTVANHIYKNSGTFGIK